MGKSHFPWYRIMFRELHEKLNSLNTIALLLPVGRGRRVGHVGAHLKRAILLLPHTSLSTGT